MMAVSADRSYFSAGHQARLGQHVDVGGARAEEGHPRVLRHLPQHARAGVSRVPVVEQRPHAQQQRADQEVPHHPAGGGMEEQPVAWAQVHVERLQLQLLDEDAAVAVGDRLRQPGGTGGEQDPQRMTERHLLELELRGRHRRVVHDLIPGLGPGIPGDRLPGRSGHVDHLLEAGQQRDDLLHLGAAVVVPAAVAVAVYAEQDLRRQLAESVADPTPAEVGGAAGPDGADAGRGQHRDHRLRDVRHAGGDPVAGADAHGAQPGGEHPDAVREIGPGQARERRGFRLVVQRVLARPLVAQHVLRVVQPGPGEPVGAGHGPGAEDRRRRRPRHRCRSSPRPPARSRRGRSPTSARARDSRRSHTRARGRATGRTR